MYGWFQLMIYFAWSQLHPKFNTRHIQSIRFTAHLSALDARYSTKNSVIIQQCSFLVLSSHHLLKITGFSFFFPIPIFKTFLRDLPNCHMTLYSTLFKPDLTLFVYILLPPLNVLHGFLEALINDLFAAKITSSLSLLPLKFISVV